MMEINLKDLHVEGSLNDVMSLFQTEALSESFESF